MSFASCAISCFAISDTTVDVLLQSGTAGMSQEADDVLFDFPELADELFQYDCIVAFDSGLDATR